MLLLYRELFFLLDDLDPIRGHAFGRTGRVGVDGRLTGVSFSIFSLLVGACPDGEEENRVVFTWMRDASFLR